jgi:hypothetical protein
MPIPLISRKLESVIISELSRIAGETVAQARSNASWSKSIPEAISAGDVVVENGRYSVDIKLDTRADGPAPEAAAFEFGSGIHSETQPGEYYIFPKQADALAFHWNPERVPWGSPKFIGFAGDGRYMFRYVEHPGVAARPYLRPAIQSTRKQMKSKLGRAFIKGLRDASVKVTVIK